MEQNNNQIDNRQPCFRKVIGNTTYVVRVYFSETLKEVLGDKFKRLIGEEARRPAWNDGEGNDDIYYMMKLRHVNLQVRRIINRQFRSVIRKRWIGLI